VSAEVIPLGSRLRQRREELGLTQSQAARQLDVARTAYRLWELEAARPAPDRWRLIAKWLGISMTAMLLAEELIDAHEAVDAHTAAATVGLSDAQWDERTGTSEGDYFSQERAMIADEARVGHLSADQTSELLQVLSRIQGATSSADTSPWYPGRFRKRFRNDNLAPPLARSALATTVIGIPAEAFENAALLISELVTNCVRHSGSDWVEVGIALANHVLRIEVTDQNRESSLRPRTADTHGGWGLTMIGELATRWGVDRHKTGKTVWIELDLT
jgi:transcriptional regulator with XRE-family HTH domain